MHAAQRSPPLPFTNHLISDANTQSPQAPWQPQPGITALVFGREESGLSEAELHLCTHACAIRTGRYQGSLNLSHAVAVVQAEVSYVCVRGSMHFLSVPFASPRTRTCLAQNDPQPPFLLCLNHCTLSCLFSFLLRSSTRQGSRSQSTLEHRGRERAVRLLKNKAPKSKKECRCLLGRSKA